MRGWMGSVIARAGESFVTRLPMEAADVLVVDTVLLVVPCMVTGETEWFFRCGIAEGEVIEFLEEGESIEVMEGVVSCLYMMESVVLMILRRRLAW